MAPGPRSVADIRSRLSHVRRTLAQWRSLRVVDERENFVIKRSFYVPLPDLDKLGDDVWDAESAMGGIAMDPATQLAWAQQELAPFVAEFEVEDGPAQPGRYRRDNRNYEAVDAEVLYAVLRANKPGRVIELGSGSSTLVAAMALRRNREDGAESRYDVYDPYPPRDILPAQLDGVSEQHVARAQDVDISAAAQLAAGDVLLVDSTHCVQIGGDVNHVVLDLLPVLAPGVLVHFHDIWLPYEYHRVLFEDMDFRWNEQYLLQAFLSGNRDWEVVFGAQAVARHDQDALKALVPSYDGTSYPSCFWIRRRQG